MKNQESRLAVFPEWVIEAFNKKKAIDICSIETDLDKGVRSLSRIGRLTQVIRLITFAVWSSALLLATILFIGGVKFSANMLAPTIDGFIIILIFTALLILLEREVTKADKFCDGFFDTFWDHFRELEDNWGKVVGLVRNPQRAKGSDNEITQTDFEVRRRSCVLFNIESRRKKSGQPIDLDRAVELSLFLNDFMQNNQRLLMLSNFLLWLGVKHTSTGSMFQSVLSDLSTTDPKEQ